MTPDDLDPIGWHGAALAARPPTRVSESDTEPRLLTPGAALLLCLLISLGLWGVIWFIVAASWQ